MSIAALMVDLDDLPSYTQENDNSWTDDGQSTLESIEHDIATLDHATGSLTNIALTLESDNDLDATAIRYLGLALDATLGKTRTIYIGGATYDTHTNVCTLEDATGEDKGGVWKTIWEFIKRQYEKVASFFKNVSEYIGRMFSKKKRIDKRLKEVTAEIEKFETSTKEFVIPKSINAILGGTEVKDLNDIVRTLGNYHDMVKRVNIAAKDEILSVIKGYSKLSKEDMADAKKETTRATNLAAALIKYGDIIKGIKGTMPGNQALILEEFKDTTAGSIMLKLPGTSGLNKNGLVFARYEGTRPDTELKLEPGTTKTDLSDLLTVLTRLSDIMGIAEEIEYTTGIRNAIKMAAGQLVRFEVSYSNMPGNVAKVFKLRSTILASPTIRLPSTLAIDVGRVLDAGVRLLDALIKS